ncbi:GNAT family N-acetyltransferase [Paenibacillus sp. PR3]|uniref:GNAT family N-acetyltransferase n=1 Tax=Paenibacillus terricola TaxID=2763503 RepID=A0ABR8N6Y2_9BACL|nr:GNAT family N-acetyltransferase [Paenibacillus terricola]MBD3922950.1 GNAT family N-acetyltransferase [Paenibacillus terricola]
MTTEVRLAVTSEKGLMENLLQLYMYDFTEFTDVDINPNGMYNVFPDFDSYWEEQRAYQPYIIRVNDAIAGFALVKETTTETRKYNYLAHFFVLRKYRRQGTGKEAAIYLFSALKGEWELYQIIRNVPAQKFWTKIIDEFTGGVYEGKIENGRRYQTFWSR